MQALNYGLHNGPYTTKIIAQSGTNKHMMGDINTLMPSRKFNTQFFLPSGNICHL